ncbi:hypothetical protein L596_022147 [Steinernema carpocapsae]|uniref:Uncharacterized protein n=1 Tax=Steinernema carpocapsae TaxID=34508 RepID=A0A4U5MKU6_STECR|nr:hypothetical protein L596_022147 [Steinernema carpocapsae]
MSTSSNAFFSTIAFFAIFALAQSLAIHNTKGREECKTICLDWYYCISKSHNAPFCADRLQGCDCLSTFKTAKTETIDLKRSSLSRDTSAERSASTTTTA